MLASRLAGTAVRMDCHGNQPRLPSGMARATAATGLHGVSRVLFFLGRGCGRLVAGVAGRLAPAPVGWRIERERGKQQLVGSVAPQPSHRGQATANGPEGRRGPAQKLPPASRQRGKKQTVPGARHRHRDHRRHGYQRRRRTTQLEQREGKLPASSRQAISRKGVPREESPLRLGQAKLDSCKPAFRGLIRTRDPANMPRSRYTA